MSEHNFYNMLTIQLLTVIHIAIKVTNKGNIHRSLKYCDLKTSKHPWKFENIKSAIVYRAETNLSKAHSTAESPFTQNIYLSSIYTYLVVTVLKSESGLNWLSFS